MRTPSDNGGEDLGDLGDKAWDNTVLTPVPKTPAPEVVARFAADILETPSAEDDDMADSPTKQTLLMRTCPPKANAYREMGEGILAQDKDEQVLLRLMAARRKSLQFAPKIGSPLARTWD